MPETRNIVFLGASYAGLGGAHYFLKHVILVDASSKFFHRVASPRAVVRPDLIPPERILLDIAPGFKQYGEDRVRVLQARATAWDDAARTLTLRAADGGEQTTLPYGALVLATGWRTQSPAFSLRGAGSEDTALALRAVHAQILGAMDIVVSGGGPASVETAGELGEALNGVPGWFAPARPAQPAVRITLVTGAGKLLPALRQSLSDQAAAYLARVGVEVRYNAKGISARPRDSDGKTVVALHDGEEVVTDVYMAGTGVEPLSAYAPARLKDDKGYIVQNAATLRVDAAGPRVYALGDVGTASSNDAPAILYGVPVFGTNIRRDLLAMHADAVAKPEGADREYAGLTKETQLVPVGRSKGVGAVLGWRVPSWFVWLIKGRDCMVGQAQAAVDGSGWVKEK